MKKLIKKWQEFVNEEKENLVVTFDFDDTLSLSHFDPELDSGWIHDGPHMPFIEKIKKHKAAGNTVHVVTSRHEANESKALENPDQKAVQEFLDEHGIEVDGVFFTNGQVKVEKLLELGASMHHDDDPEEIHAAEQAGITAIVSDPYDDYGSLKDSWLDTLK